MSFPSLFTAWNNPILSQIAVQENRPWKLRAEHQSSEQWRRFCSLGCAEPLTVLHCVASAHVYCTLPFVALDKHFSIGWGLSSHDWRSGLHQKQLVICCTRFIWFRCLAEEVTESILCDRHFEVSYCSVISVSVRWSKPRRALKMVKRIWCPGFTWR